MTDRFVCVIDIKAYNSDPDKRDFAEELMKRYGYDRKQVGEIRYTDRRIEFKIRTDSENPESVWKWVEHDR